MALDSDFFSPKACEAGAPLLPAAFPSAFSENTLAPIPLQPSLSSTSSSIVSIVTFNQFYLNHGVSICGIPSWPQG